MRLALLVILLAGAASALVVGPRIHGQDDLGDPMLSQFTYSLSADCGSAAITVVVMDERIRPVDGAKTYLRYVDFSAPLIGTGVSGKDGRILFELPGKPEFMRGLFILLIEKGGYRNKEVYFDISPCFTDTVKPVPPAKPEDIAQEEAPEPEEEIAVPEEPGEQNHFDDAAEQPGIEDADVETPAWCLPALALPFLPLFLKREVWKH